MPAPVPTIGNLIRPQHVSSLTAWATHDLDKEHWVPLHEQRLTLPPSSFWHVVDIVTVHQHWNRTIYSQTLLQSEHVQLSDGASVPDHDGAMYCAPPPKGKRVNALRRLSRKTPAPIGGTQDNHGRTYDAYEWTAQWTDHSDPHPVQVTDKRGRHVACFGLSIPDHVVTEDNPRALRYWPFQYPKTRAYRFVYEPAPPSTTDDTESQPGYVLRYEVVPLGHEAKSPRDFEALVKHARPSGIKLVTHFRKRMAHYDEKLGTSTYVKRVVHDNMMSEIRFRRWYDDMKIRHAPQIRTWSQTPDLLLKPYEELAIAAYLCALWEAEREEEGWYDDHEEVEEVEEVDDVDSGDVSEAMGEVIKKLDKYEIATTKRRKQKQTFIDIGCGNGLLVYLLICEGHCGIGVDLQKRPIWSLYPSEIREALHHEKLDPLTYDCSPYDWIIGNHSDELSPWVPVLAARAQQSLSCRQLVDQPKTLHNPEDKPVRRAHPRFFLLPCCFYDFDGKKVAFGHMRRTIGVKAPHGMGKYEVYYRWIESIMRVFGFTAEYENLRIPSTKYVCLLGRFVQHESRISDDVVREMSALVLLDAQLSRRMK